MHAARHACRLSHLSNFSALLQVAESASSSERGYVGASVYRGHMSLMRLISQLPCLRWLDLRKYPSRIALPPGTRPGALTSLFVEKGASCHIILVGNSSRRV
jgi:hypothetical protein